MRTLAILGLGSFALASLGACTQTYHPEYHPQSAVTYVQNVTYAHNLTYGTSNSSTPVAQVDVDLAAPYLMPGDTAPVSRPMPAAPKPEDRRPGTVRTPGAVVVYGNLNGNVYLGR